MLFGVPDEIPDVTRSSGMVRGKDLYMGSHHMVTGIIRGLPVLYRDHRRGSGGPPGGSTCPGGPYGLYVEGNQPLSGLGAISPRPHAPRVGGTLKGAPPLAWGPTHPKGRSHLPWLPPPRGNPRAPPLALAPIYSGGFGVAQHTSLSLPRRSPTSLPPRLS